jgi:hypothetical protein
MLRPVEEALNEMESRFRQWLSGVLDRLERAPPKPRVMLHRVEPESPYHAVSIRPGLVSCEASQQFGNRRFLSKKAPRLPLPECTCPNCECSYTHYDDRRQGIDRRKEIATQPAAAIVERRLNHGRRATDAVGFSDPQATR